MNTRTNYVCLSKQVCEKTNFDIKELAPVTKQTSFNTCKPLKRSLCDSTSETVHLIAPTLPVIKLRLSKRQSLAIALGRHRKQLHPLRTGKLLASFEASVSLAHVEAVLLSASSAVAASHSLKFASAPS